MKSLAIVILATAVWRYLVILRLITSYDQHVYKI